MDEGSLQRDYTEVKAQERTSEGLKAEWVMGEEEMSFPVQ